METLELIGRHRRLVDDSFGWGGNYQTVKQYVKGYAACHRAKSTNQKPYDLLQPLEVPNEQWQ